MNCDDFLILKIILNKKLFHRTIKFFRKNKIKSFINLLLMLIENLIMYKNLTDLEIKKNK